MQDLKSETIMWEGNVRYLPLAEQIRATVLAGFDGLSITPLKHADMLATGLSTEDMLAMCADAGIRLCHLDPLCTWVRRWEPVNIDFNAMPKAFFETPVDDFLRLAEKLRIGTMTAMTVAPAGSMTVDEMTEDFAALCDRAADFGVHCDLEFIPMDWAIPDLAMAWHIVRTANRPNSGITFDFWHFVRSRSTFELLAGIPGEKIGCVQVTDGLAEVPAHRSRFDDCLQDRLLPGAGAFPIAELMATLARTGGLSRIGPEIFSARFDAMPVESVAADCKRALAAVMP